MNTGGPPAHGSKPSAGNPPAIPSLSREEQETLAGPGLEEGDASENLGAQEAESLGRDESEAQLEKRARKNEADRTEKFRDAFETIATCTLWFIAIAMWLVAAIWISHLILPERCLWLSPEQMDRVQTVSISALLASVITSHFRKRLR